LRGTIVEKGDLAEPAEAAAWDNWLLPPVWPGITRLTLDVRSFLPIDELGYGMITSGSLEHYFRFPLKIGLKLEPLALISHGEGTGVVTELRGSIGYWHNYFELTIDPGAQLAYHGNQHFSLGYSFRIGSLDGFHLTFHNAYIVESDVYHTGLKKEKFAFGSAGGEMQFPVHRRANLVVEGGGSTDYGYGLIGVRGFVLGAGGPGTLILSAGIGGAYVDDKPRSGQAEVKGYGPMLNLGLESRF
jgi:hypothetical protein